MWNKAVSRRLSAFALALTLSGCTSLSDCKYELGQKIRTKQAWHEFDGCHAECFTIDYRNGWKAGYYDVVTGGKGCPPVVAPKEYWKPPVFCAYDPSRRDEWYCGFLDGAACAKCEPDYHYLPTYLPRPACCPPQLPCYPQIPDGPEMFPMEYVDGNSGNSDPDGEEAPPAPSSEGDGGEGPMPAPGDKAPASGSEAEQPSPTEQYEKDPAASESQTNPPGTTSLLDTLIRQSQHQQVSASRASLVEQLVLNAAEPASGSGF